MSNILSDLGSFWTPFRASSKHCIRMVGLGRAKDAKRFGDLHKGMLTCPEANQDISCGTLLAEG